MYVLQHLLCSVSISYQCYYHEVPDGGRGHEVPDGGTRHEVPIGGTGHEVPDGGTGHEPQVGLKSATFCILDRCSTN